MNKSSSPLSQKYSQRKVLITESEVDPFSVVLVEDLLSGTNDWRNVQDIIRLTFKALTDVVKNQGEAIRDLERQNISNVKIVNLQDYLDSKANVEDVKESLNELAQILEGRPSFDDLQNRFQQCTLKEDFDYMISSKVSHQEIKVMLETKVNVNQFSSEIDGLYAKLDEQVQDLRSYRNNFQQDILSISNQLAQKANLEEVNEQLDQKANKQSVANALQRKANKVEIDAMLARKAETTDIQNLLTMVESKVDYHQLEKINQLLDCKVEKNDFNLLVNSLSNKADRTDVEIIQSQIQQASNEIEAFKQLQDKEVSVIKNQLEDLRFNTTQTLNKKAEQKELDKIYNQVAQKADIDLLNQMSNQLRNELIKDMQDMKDQTINFRKAQEEQVQDKFKKNEQLFDNLREEILKAHENIKSVNEERRNDQEQMQNFNKGLLANYKKEIQKEIQYLLDDLETLKKEFNENFLLKLDKNEFIDFRVKVLNSLEEKTDLMEVQNALNACQSDISQRFLELKDEIKNYIGENEANLLQILDKKANFVDVQQALSQKADNTNVLNLLATKVSSQEIEDMRKMVEKVFRECEDKVNLKDFDHFANQANLAIEELQRDMLLKSNIKDVCTLLDAKSNIDDVNRALSDIHRELEKKSYQEDLNNIVSDQAIINEQLCTENIVGRWTWKSGEIKAGSLIPWEVQLVNTLPDNYLWEKEKTSILVVAPGLYEVTLGFFAKKKPTIQILINGEPIMSAVNTASYVMHHSSGKIKDIKHSAGTITGLTLVDFIILPARARISLTYTGEFGGEGFFGLKRL
ncbi:hypothetical protein ABPG72_021995 [Tetrahymena utriculariae]